MYAPQSLCWCRALALHAAAHWPSCNHTTKQRAGYFFMFSLLQLRRTCMSSRGSSRKRRSSSKSRKPVAPVGRDSIKHAFLYYPFLKTFTELAETAGTATNTVANNNGVLDTSGSKPKLKTGRLTLDHSIAELLLFKRFMEAAQLVPYPHSFGQRFVDLFFAEDLLTLATTVTDAKKEKLAEMMAAVEEAFEGDKLKSLTVEKQSIAWEKILAAGGLSLKDLGRF